MQNDISRQWAFLTPFVPGEMLAAQAQQIETLGMAGIFVPEIYSDPFMGLGFCAAVTSRVQLASGVKVAAASNPFEIAMTAMDLDRLSGGRVVIGLGASIRNWVEGFHGRPQPKPVTHLRESIQVIREVVAKSHIPGALQTFEGDQLHHDWRTFVGAFAPPVRERIPIWVAGNQTALTRLAGEVADGFIDHPAHGPHWAATHGRDALAEGLKKAGRDRKDIHWSCWLWVAVNNDRAEAVNDAKATVAFYAGMRQYQPMFATMGFDKESMACVDAFERGDMAGWIGAITDEMAEAFVVLGPPDECRKRVEEVWDLADSFCLVPPIGGLPPEKIMFYIGGIAEAFYS